MQDSRGSPWNHFSLGIALHGGRGAGGILCSNFVQLGWEAKEKICQLPWGKNVWEVGSSVVLLCFSVWGKVSSESGTLTVLAKVHPWGGGWSWKEVLLEKKRHKVLKDGQEARSSVICISQRLQKVQAVRWRVGFTLAHRRCSVVDFWSTEKFMWGSSPLYLSSFSSGKATTDIGKSIFVFYTNLKCIGHLCEPV